MKTEVLTLSLKILQTYFKNTCNHRALLAIFTTSDQRWRMGKKRSPQKKMERYTELIEAIKVLDTARVKVIREAYYVTTPAQRLLSRAIDYLDKQATIALYGNEEVGA